MKFKIMKLPTRCFQLGINSQLAGVAARNARNLLFTTPFKLFF